ncbi:MAG: ferredoxin [Planctomycetes bacterium]|nr:ferredoxin [Planctomycetota bacterium]
MAIDVIVNPGGCWGRLIGEDCDQGACDQCVQMCPEVFEKPIANACARVRLGADLARHVERIRQAIEACPSDAIRLLAR